MFAQFSFFFALIKECNLAQNVNNLQNYRKNSVGIEINSLKFY